MHLEQVRRYNLVPARGTTVPPLYLHEVARYNGTALVPARGTRVIFPGVISEKRQESHKRTTSRYKGGTGVPHEGTGVAPSYLLRVQGWYRRTSRGTAVPPEGAHMVPSCLLESARGALSIPSEPPPPGTRDCDHTQPQLILNAQQTSSQGDHLVWERRKTIK